MHYESRYNPPHKAYDFYSALALVRFMKWSDSADLAGRRMFYCNKYGLALVSEHETWRATREAYIHGMDVKDADEDSEFIRAKKANFRIEIDAMRSIEDLPCIQVESLSFWDSWNENVISLCMQEYARQAHN